MLYIPTYYICYMSYFIYPIACMFYNILYINSCNNTISDIYIYIYVYTYIYIYMCIYIYTQTKYHYMYYLLYICIYIYIYVYLITIYVYIVYIVYITYYMLHSTHHPNPEGPLRFAVAPDAAAGPSWSFGLGGFRGLGV